MSAVVTFIGYHDSGNLGKPGGISSEKTWLPSCSDKVEQ